MSKLSSGKERVNFLLPPSLFLFFSLPSLSLFLSSCHSVSSCAPFCLIPPLCTSFRLLSLRTSSPLTHIRKFYLWIVDVCVCLNTTLCCSQSHVFFISPYKQRKTHLSLSPALIAIINIIAVCKKERAAFCVLAGR